MIQGRTMTGAFLFNDSAVLMLKRSENKRIAPGLWACIGGHVEANEYNNPEISCLREISEETGINVGQMENLKLRYILIRQKGTEINHHYIFFGESNTRDVLDCDEGELHWINFSEIMNLEMPMTLRLMLSHYRNNRDSGVCQDSCRDSPK
jgi:8-oxo-dGTP diphosphatase